MVNFQDLRITPDGRKLCIDAIIAPYNFYEGEYITSITIDTEETFSLNGPSDSPVYFKEFTEENKQQSLILNASDFGYETFADHLYYVYATVGGVPDSETPCGWDTINTLGVVLWWQPIYHQGINHMRRVIDKSCGIDKEFIDYVLRLKSFELALKTSQFELVNSKFKEWFTKKEFVVTQGCK